MFQLRLKLSDCREDALVPIGNDEEWRAGSEVDRLQRTLRDGNWLKKIIIRARLCRKTNKGI